MRYKKIPPGRRDGGRRADTRRAQAMAADPYTVLSSQAVGHVAAGGGHLVLRGDRFGILPKQKAA